MSEHGQLYDQTSDKTLSNTLGQTQGLMANSPEAQAAGTAGWLDAVSYMTGLSGGSWAVGSFMANGGALPSDLAKDVWNLAESFIYPTSTNITTYYSELFSLAAAKQAAGFPVQVTDVYGLALGEHLLPTKWRMAGTPNITFSQLLSEVAELQNASLPYPIITAVGLEDPAASGNITSVVWEFSPHEFGSWSLGTESSIEGYFTPIEYLGSGVSAGASNGTCYKGLDQLTFVMGTSATLFNEMAASGISITALLSATAEELAIFNNVTENVSTIPNPFVGESLVANTVADESTLTLVDGGENDQTIPISPLLAKDRAVDVIVAFDSAGDTATTWPDGASMLATYEAAVAEAQWTNSTPSFPEVPSTNTFINLGLNTRPTFFGCNSTDTPLVIYVPNYPWLYMSNTATLQLAYPNASAVAQLESTQMSMTLNGTVAAWPTCLACAFTDRANYTTASNRSADCTKCFDAFCWDGTTNDTTPAAYNVSVGVPEFIKNLNLTLGGSSSDSFTTTSKSAAVGRQTGKLAVAAGVVAAGLALVM